MTGYVAQGKWHGEGCSWWDITICGAPVSLRAARIAARKAAEHFEAVLARGETMRTGLRTRIIKRTIIEEGLR